MKNDLFLSWPGIFIAVALVFSVFAWWQSSRLNRSMWSEPSGSSRAGGGSLPERRLGWSVPATLAGLQEFFSAEGRATRTRISLIAADGEVIADSDEQPGNMDNHGRASRSRGGDAGFREGGGELFGDPSQFDERAPDDLLRNADCDRRPALCAAGGLFDS